MSKTTQTHPLPTHDFNHDSLDSVLYEYQCSSIHGLLVFRQHGQFWNEDLCTWQYAKAFRAWLIANNYEFVGLSPVRDTDW